MSIVTLLSKSPQRRIGPEPEDGGLLLDAVLEEGIEYDTLVTGYPIELGADINDHIIVQPGMYTLTGAVTDNPIHWSATDYQHADARTRHLSAFAILRDIQKKRTVFSIKTGYLDLDDMVIRNFRSKKDAETAHLFRFEAILQQLNLVESQEVTITSQMVEADTQAEQALPADNAGQQAGEDVGSLAADISDAAASIGDSIGAASDRLVEYAKDFFTSAPTP